MASQDWARKYAFEARSTSRTALRELLVEADRLLADAEVTGVSVASRHALAHGAVILLARLALSAAGYRTLENHHYWALESLKHTLGLSDDEVDILHAHRNQRHNALYGSSRSVSEADLRDLRERAADLRQRVLNWLRTEHADLWGSDTA